MTQLWNPSCCYSIPDAATMGDAIQFSRFPEFHYKDFGKKLKLLYKDRFNLFSFNPHVDIVSSFDGTVVDLWNNSYEFSIGSPVYRQLSKFRDMTGIDRDLKPTLCMEFNQKAENRIAIITEASRRFQKGRTREIPREISRMLVSMLSERFRFVQLGGKDDYLASETVEDLRGLSILEMAIEMSKCNYVICTNSGPMHIAAATPTQVVMYLNEPIERPVWTSDISMYTAHDWLYDSSIYIGPPNRKNVMPFMDFIGSLL